MRIAIDATFRMHGGGMIHLRHFLAAWRRQQLDRQHTLVLFTRADNLDRLGTLDGRIELVTLPRSGFRPALRLVWQQLRLPELARRLGADVLFCPGNFSPFRSRIPVVVAFQNAAPFCSSVTPRRVGLPHWLSYKTSGWMMRLSARRADRVVFISKYFRDLFVGRFRFPGERGDVVYHGSDAFAGLTANPALLERLGIQWPFILSVSHLYRYKNLPALIEGYALARQALQARGLRLVIVGKAVDRAHYRQIQHRVRALELEDWVVFPGWVPHGEVGTLLAKCESFVFQSTCENCPNTLIEALAAGVPVLSSDAGVMPEIGGDAAVYFDPFEPRSISEALVRVAGDAELRREMSRRSLQQAKRFPTWDEVVTQTLRSLEQAVGGSVAPSVHASSTR
jgi:glycosyltransferase involved in cell wall biosynthesis